MTDDSVYSHPLRRSDLAGRKPTRFALTPDADTRAAIARALGISAVTRATLKGEIRPQGRADFTLEAELDAEVVQPCVITLAPVTSQIRDNVVRRYLADWQEPEAEESEVPEDDSVEPLGDAIDVGAVLTEALALALPLYPRVAGAELGSFQYGAPGAEPLAEEKMRPFAGLSELLKKRPD